VAEVSIQAGLAKKEITQPYALARARYNFNAYEMKIFVFILKYFQNSHQDQLEGETKPMNKKDLFDNHYFQGIKVSDIDKNTPYQRFKEALRSLNDKKIIIKTEEYEADARFIETPKYYEKKGMFDFMLNKELVPAFESMAQGWFSFNPETLFKLNSHGQRFYILMCQHEDTGIVKIHAKELRDVLDMKDKYKKFSVFKKWVIDTAEKEITALFETNQCKLKFVYDKKLSKSKTKNDDWDRMLHFNVVSYNNANRKESVQDKEQNRSNNHSYCVYTLSRIYENNDGYRNAILEFISGFKAEEMQALKDRFDRMRKNYVEKGIRIENNEDAQKIVSKILKDDFGYVKKEIKDLTAYTKKAIRDKG
jgi:Initiator Replication protein